MMSCLPSALHRFRFALLCRPTPDLCYSMLILRNRPRFCSVEPHPTVRAQTGALQIKAQMIGHAGPSTDLTSQTHVLSP